VLLLSFRSVVQRRTRFEEPEQDFAPGALCRGGLARPGVVTPKENTVNARAWKQAFPERTSGMTMAIRHSETTDRVTLESNSITPPARFAHDPTVVARLGSPQPAEPCIPQHHPSAYSTWISTMRQKATWACMHRSCPDDRFSLSTDPAKSARDYTIRLTRAPPQRPDANRDMADCAALGPFHAEGADPAPSVGSRDVLRRSRSWRRSYVLTAGFFFSCASLWSARTGPC